MCQGTPCRGSGCGIPDFPSTCASAIGSSTPSTWPPGSENPPTPAFVAAAGSESYCTLASPAYQACQGTPQHPDELVSHDCVNVRLRKSHHLLCWLFRIGAVEITSKAGIAIDNSDGVSAVLAARGGVAAFRPRTSPRPIPSAADWCRSLQSLHRSAQASRPFGHRVGAASPNVKALLTVLAKLSMSLPLWVEVFVIGSLIFTRIASNSYFGGDFGLERTRLRSSSQQRSEKIRRHSRAPDILGTCRRR